MHTYNLTCTQKLFLPLTWLMWMLYVGDDKKSWHEVKKGMEKHTCFYKKPERKHGMMFYKCEHEGCYTYDTEPSK